MHIARNNYHIPHIHPDSALDKTQFTDVSPVPTPDHLLAILRESNLNWFAFVAKISYVITQL